MKNLNILIFFFAMALPFASYAQINNDQKISVQGFLKDGNGNAVADGSYDITFKVFDDETIGTELWSEEYSVNVNGGVYSVLLGDGISGISWANNNFLEVEIGGVALTPRTPFTYSPYSISVASTAVAGEVLCSGAVGDVKYSILDPVQFALVNGDCWVPMDGATNIQGTALQPFLEAQANYAYTSSSTVPDMSGAFIRSHEYNLDIDQDRDLNSGIASFQAEEFKSHSHVFTGVTDSDGAHTHPFADWYDTDNLAEGIIRGGTNDTEAEGDSNIRRKYRNATTDSSGSHTHSFSGTTNAEGASETRPDNFNFYTYIRIN